MSAFFVVPDLVHRVSSRSRLQEHYLISSGYIQPSDLECENGRRWEDNTVRVSNIDHSFSCNENARTRVSQNKDKVIYSKPPYTYLDVMRAETFMALSTSFYSSQLSCS